MKKILFSMFLLVFGLCLGGCKAKTPIIDWVIYRVGTPDEELIVNKDGGLYDHMSLTTDKITISFDEDSFEFVDYDNNKHIGTYSREQKGKINMYFENGETVVADRNWPGWAYRSHNLIFTFNDIEYEFYEVCDKYPEFSTEELESKLRVIGSQIREIYENEDFDCEHGSNYCAENICRAMIIIDGNKIILRCLNNKCSDIDISELLEQGSFRVICYEIDSTDLVKKMTNIKPGICIFRPRCNGPMAIYFFSE